MIGKYNIKIGDVFGQWEVIGQGSKPYYSKCRCTCGTIRDVSNRSLCAGNSKSCGCNKEYLKARRKESSVKTGDRFGMWKVIGESSRPYSVLCKCDCGTVRNVYSRMLLAGKSKSCGCNKEHVKTTSKKISETNLRIAQKKVGTSINGFRIVSIFKKKGENVFYCKAICPVCGKETETKLSRLKKNYMCVNCNRNNGDFLKEIQKSCYVDGSCLPSIRSRENGTVNKNSSTKVNGVSLQKDGSYRAYITFRHKQYHLGVYASLEEAASARKEAEKKLFGEYIKSHQGWEDELKEIGKRHRKKP